MVPKKKTYPPTPAPTLKPTPPKEEIKVIKPKMEEVKSRKGYIAICRAKGTDEWTIPQQMVRRNKEMLTGTIPPASEEAFIIELDLPFANK